MDLEEWEVLSDDGFLEIQEDDGGKGILSRKYVGDPKIVFNMNYFICKSPISKEKIFDPQEMMGNQFLPIPPPVELEKVDFPIIETEQQVKSPGGVVWETDYIVSQVSFKKMKENEFVDMKMDSPRAGAGGWGGIMPRVDSGLFQFEDEISEVGIEFESGKKESGESDSKGEREREINGGVNIFKWSLSGIGAICSFGVAAATICVVVILGNGNGNHHQRNKLHNQKIQFQFFTDEKRINQVVHHAVPLTAAHFSYCGGYHDHGSLDL